MRAGDALGLSKADRLKLRDVRQGEFHAFGSAFGQPGVVCFRSEQVRTTHPRPGERHLLTAPAPSRAIRGVLAKFAGFPQEAEGEIRNLDEARRRIAELERQIKSLNDAKGHIAGDRYLVQIAGTVRKAVSRTSDFVARYGGEEFAVILPATDGAGAKIAAEKVRKAVADLRLSHPGSDFGTVTVSVGVATFDGSAPGSPADLTVTADNALYIAKREGRNLSVFGGLDSLGSAANAKAYKGAEGESSDPHFY